jgi:hypothetical protein
MPIADFRPALRAYLIADAALSAMVGGERVFPVVLPQGVTAASIVYTRISGQGDHDMSGPSGLNRVRVQIDAWSQDADEADALARLIKARLDGFSGPISLGGSPEASVTVQGAFFDTQRDDYDSEAEMHRVSQDFLCWVEER